MPRPPLIFSQSDYSIWIVTINHILNGKQCRSRSVGFFRSQLIWIYTVCKTGYIRVQQDKGFNLWVYVKGLILDLFWSFWEQIWESYLWDHLFAIFFLLKFCQQKQHSVQSTKTTGLTRNTKTSSISSLWGIQCIKKSSWAYQIHLSLLPFDNNFISRFNVQIGITCKGEILAVSRGMQDFLTAMPKSYCTGIQMSINPCHAE